MKFAALLERDLVFSLENPGTAFSFLKENSFDIIRQDEILYHCFWCGELSRKQVFSIRSAAATQKNARIIFWLDPDFLPSRDTYVRQIERLGEIRVYDTNAEFGQDQMLFQVSQLARNAERAAWSDTCRMMMLAKYGGIYFDLDICFLRDLSQIMDSDFAYIWEMVPWRINTAVCAVALGSPKMPRIFARGIEAGRFHPWNLGDELPALARPFFDIGWSGDSRFMSWDGFFQKATPEHNVMDYLNVLFAYHWHNRWDMPVEEGSPFDLLDSFFCEVLGIPKEI